MSIAAQCTCGHEAYYCTGRGNCPKTDLEILKLMSEQSQPPPLTQGRMYVEVDVLIERMATIREQAKNKIAHRTNKLSEAYIEGSSCLEVIEELLPLVSKITAAMSANVPHTPAPAVSDARSYQIDFGSHLRCQVKIVSNKIEVVGAIDGWGNDLHLKGVVIEELETPKAAATPAPIASGGDVCDRCGAKMKHDGINVIYPSCEE